MQTMRLQLALASTVLLIASTVLTPFSPQVNAQGVALYDLIDLGILIDEDIDQPDGACVGLDGSITGLNDNRLVVGYYPRSEAIVSPALYLGETFLRLEAGAGGGQVRAVNNAGVMVGVTYDKARTDPCKMPTGRQAAIWFGQDLDPLTMPSGGTESQANDINEANAAVGWYVRRDEVRPIIWEDNAASPLELPLLKEARATEGQALAINDSGDAAGYVRWRESGEVVRQTAVHWQDGTAVRLETLGNKIGNVATDLNEQGDIVGYARTKEDETVAVVWSGDQIEALPTVRLASESRALAVNEAGDAVGFMVTNSGQVAVLWAADSVILLNALIEPGSGLTLIEATAINEKGVIAGVAVDSAGVRHGFVLVPVEAAG